MKIDHAKWADETKGSVVVTMDGALLSVPAMPGNRHYDHLLSSKVSIEPPDATAVSADQVRAECQRRMMRMVGARDGRHLEIILVNGLREVARLLRIGEANWLQPEALRAAELAAVDHGIEALRAASNVLELDPPQDYTNDRYWPAI